ncbi:conserved hypothetical protein [Prevotella intermedia]|nr:conserved hypothetical proteinin [Prevotella intermedia]BAU19002.1 conserved hypothetical protein [Prevotella intermedia]
MASCFFPVFPAFPKSFPISSYTYNLAA